MKRAAGLLLVAGLALVVDEAAAGVSGSRNIGCLLSDVLAGLLDEEPIAMRRNNPQRMVCLKFALQQLSLCREYRFPDQRDKSLWTFPLAS